MCLRKLVKGGEGVAVGTFLAKGITSGAATSRDSRVDATGTLERLHCIPRPGVHVDEEGPECEGFLVTVDGRSLDGTAMDAAAEAWARASADEVALHGYAAWSAGLFFLEAPHHASLCDPASPSPSPSSESADTASADVEPSGTVACSLGTQRRVLFRNHAHFAEATEEHLKAAHRRRLQPFTSGARTVGPQTTVVVAVKFTDLDFSSMASKASDKLSNETNDEWAVRMCGEDHLVAYKTWKRMSYGQSEKSMDLVPTVLTMSGVLASAQPGAGEIADAAKAAMAAAGYDYEDYTYTCTSLLGVSGTAPPTRYNDETIFLRVVCSGLLPRHAVVRVGRACDGARPFHVDHESVRAHRPSPIAHRQDDGAMCCCATHASDGDSQWRRSGLREEIGVHEMCRYGIYILAHEHGHNAGCT
jgi:hypothetical protein